MSVVASTYRIGVDGGGTKTELILVDETGTIVTRHLAPGCNPNTAGPERARTTILDALGQIHREPVTSTHLYMAGSPGWWRELAAELRDFGVVTTHRDALPVLELATDGRPGLVLHGGTGSFVAARTPDDVVHDAGGLGWRFGDPGSGYDLGRRVIARGLLELQGWAPRTRFGTLVQQQSGLPETETNVTALTRHFYQNRDPNKTIAALAPAVLHLATEGDEPARKMVLESAKPLLDLALQVATRLFPTTPLDELPAGLSGPILTHPTVQAALVPLSPLPLSPVMEAPIMGVHRLMTRD